MQHPIGARVGVDHDKYPGVWIVCKNGPVNATLEAEGGQGLRKLRCPHTLLTAPPVAGAVPGSTVQAVPLPEHYVLGEFVRLSSGKHAGLYVVIKDSGSDKVNLAKPGGDSDRYLRVDRRGLTRVSVSEVLK